MSNVVIDIAAQFTGKPAFKKADTAVTKLNDNTKNFSKTLARTFGTAAVLAFGRASVKAFAEDDKAATSLGQTLKNLNLAYGSNIGTVNGYISRLEEQTGVLDDELRPAMDRFLRATSSVTKSQELLNLALDVAAGTGKSVTQVSQSLQKAYLGQTQAIGRLGVGLTKADIASSSFEEIQQKLTTLFAGQASAAAETFAGQLDKLTIAANNAKETIGKGLYDAITSLSGGGATAATDNIDKLATGIADSLKNAGQLIDKLDKIKPVLIAFGIAAGAAFLPITTAIAGAIFLMGDLNKRLNEQSFRKGIIPGGMGNISMTVSGKVDNKLAKEQAKLQKDTSKATKDALKLAKAKAVFDLQKIQIEAALKGKISEEDKIRLKLLKAIEDENLTNIEKYQKALDLAQTKSKELAALLAVVKIDEIKDPFSQWSIDPLTVSINALTASIGGVGTAITATGVEWSSLTGNIATTVIQPNLKEWSSSFSTALTAVTTSTTGAINSTQKAASDATSAVAASTATAISSTQTAADAATAASIAATNAALSALAASGVATTGVIVSTASAATSALQKLHADANASLASTAAQTTEEFMADSAAALAALQAKLADEAAAWKEAAEAAQAAAEAISILGTNDYATRNAAAIAAATAAAAAEAAAASAAAGSVGGGSKGAGGNNVMVTVNVDGSVISQNDLAAFVTDAINNASSAGNAVTFDRTAEIMTIK